MMSKDQWIAECERICENCRFWDSSTKHGSDDQDITGLCRRKAPRINKITGLAIWPFTEDSDWCGSFQESDHPTTKEETDG